MTWYEKLDKVIGDYLPDLPMERDVPMDRFTSFRIGGTARRLACPKNREQLVILMGLARELSLIHIWPALTLRWMARCAVACR